jgi:hypothetical protein
MPTGAAGFVPGGSEHLRQITAAIQQGHEPPMTMTAKGPSLAQVARLLSGANGVTLETAQQQVLQAADRARKSNKGKR